MWLSRFRLGWFRLWSIWLSQVAVVVEQLELAVVQVVAVLAVSSLVPFL
jgi:hypothetical protein